MTHAGIGGRVPSWLQWEPKEYRIIAVEGSSLEPVQLARNVANLASDIKGENIVIMDMRQVSPVTDFFVIFSAAADRQLQAIINHIEDETKKQQGIVPWRIEGTPEHGWVLMDYGDVVVHGFLPDRRAYYDLEGLWRDALIVVRIQ